MAAEKIGVNGAATREATAQSLYEELSTGRSRALQIARQASELTIPALLPPEGANNSTEIKQPYQSLGAYGVNNLASKLLLALYPPGHNFFRYLMPVEVADEAQKLPPEQRADLEKKLGAAENLVLQKFEASGVRPQKAESLLHLIVAGNVLTYFPSLEDFRMYSLDKYVVRRNAAGAPLDVVVKEMVTPRALSAETLEATHVKADSREDVAVYTHIKWDKGRCTWASEINGHRVPDSDGDAPADLSPWNALRWKAVPNQDYGRGHVEEYLGDLMSLEGLSQAHIDFAAAAGKILLLIDPGSTTNIDEVNRARSGDAVAGRLDDIGVLQLDKFHDFQVVERTIARLEERLSRAFLLRSGLVRDAERVTAEEIRATAQELEDTIGGVYTVLAQEEQMPFVNRLLSVLTRKGVLPRFPPNTVEPVVVTGFQALGRNHALNKLRGAIQDLQNLFGPEGALALLQGSPVANRILTGWGVEDPAAIVKTADQVAQENAAKAQQQMVQTLMEKGTGPAVAGAMSQK